MCLVGVGGKRRHSDREWDIPGTNGSGLPRGGIAGEKCFTNVTENLGHGGGEAE